MKKSLILGAAFFVVLFGFQNCSKTAFDSEESQQSSTGEAPEEDVPVDVTSNVEFPKISTTIPDCQPNTKCTVTFKLSKPSTLHLRFHWRTDDDPNSQWKTGALPANVIWGLVNVHYQAGVGEVEFAPGVVTRSIEVQNINQTASGIRFKILLNQCALGEAYYRCQLFF